MTLCSENLKPLFILWILPAGKLLCINKKPPKRKKQTNPKSKPKPQINKTNKQKKPTKKNTYHKIQRRKVG